MRRVQLLVLALMATAGATAVTATPASAAAAPKTVPALQQWTAGTGAGYTFAPGTRVVVDPAYPSLDDEAATFADDLKLTTGIGVSVVHGAASPGDLFLTLGSTDSALGAEGYSLAISDHVRVQARADAGAFYGTRTVLQLLRSGYSIPAGTARDWPAKPERGLMVDVGRKFYPFDRLKDLVRELAYLKLNYLHLHLSDNLGFRLESARHPGIVSPDHYTKAQITELVALAASYHITVVPEIDMPGHMNPILAAYPQLKLVSNTGGVNHGYLDLGKEEAYGLLEDLITEYLPLFPGPYWHIGADEYVRNYSAYPQLLQYARAHYGPDAVAQDTYYGFINWANDIVRAAGKTTRMWNDGIKNDGTIRPDPNIIVEYWSGQGLSPQQLLDRGHVLMNAPQNPSYYTPNQNSPDVYPMYETWTADTFVGGRTIDDPARNLGSKIHNWNDQAPRATVDEILAGLKYPLRIMAQQTWGSPKPTSGYDGFSAFTDAIGRSPGWPTSLPGNLALDRPVTVSSTEVPWLPGDAAVDNSAATRWSSQYTDATWIQVDLGVAVDVGRVVLRWDGAFGSGYRIQVSDNGTSWTDIYSTTTGDGRVDDLTGLSGSGRYVRMLGTKRGTPFGYSLMEFEVYAGLSGRYTVTDSAFGRAASTGASFYGNVISESAAAGAVNRMWHLAGSAAGTYTITNEQAGLCLDVHGASTAPGARVILWTCHGGLNQRWEVRPAASGGFTIRSVNSNLLLTAGAAGAALTQENGAGPSPAQRWHLEAAH